jgi:aldose 1-epimerase
VAGQGADDRSAWLTGEFRGSLDAPDCRALWPSDYVLRVTYRLAARQLRIEAEVENPDRIPLPFGLGYHPYFRTQPGPGATADDCQVEAAGASYWVLDDMLPTGALRPASGERDLNQPRRFKDLTLDDVLTGVPREPGADGLCRRGGLRWPTALALRVLASADFRETVLFTPAHRESFCIEPYTCTSDAINLQQRGVDAGWRVLPPGGKWNGVVEMALVPV